VIDDGSLSGQTGVIWCAAGDVASFEYFKDPAKTGAAWTTLPGQTRAFTVGDLGRIDDDGYLYLHGRRTDLIVTGGVNVYPAEVESELRVCPDVRDVAVYGLPDAEWGERVCAAVVATDSTSTIAAIQSWARSELAPYRRPKQVLLVADLPLTSTGKVRRDGLAQWAADHAR
jgi:long-chain acyl-CoA synthetase